MSDEQLHYEMGTAFLGVCFAETEAETVRAHLDFSRCALELARRNRPHERARKRRYSQPRGEDSGEVKG